MTDSSYQTINYIEQGGENWHIDGYLFRNNEDVTQYIWNPREIVYINQESDLGEAANGVITLESKIYHFNTIISTTNKIQLPDAYIQFQGNKLGEGGFFYLGTESAFNGTMTGNNSVLFKWDFVIGSPYGSVFNIENQGENFLVLNNVLISLVNSIGTITGGNISIDNLLLSNYSAGFSINDMDLVSLVSVVAQFGNNVAGTKIFDINNCDNMSVQNMNLQLGSNECAFDITGTISRANINSILPNLPDNVFCAGSLDNTDAELYTYGIRGLPDSDILGIITVSEQTTETAITAIGKYEPINTTFSTQLEKLERTTFVSSDGGIIYNGLETYNLKLSGWVSMKGSTGTQYDMNCRTVLLNNQVSCTFDDSTDYITATAHGLSNDDIVELEEDGGLPANLSENVPYFVINKTDNTFQISLTSGGSAIDFGSDGTLSNYFRKLTFQTASAVVTANNQRTLGSSINDIITMSTGQKIKLYIANLDAIVNVVVTDMYVKLTR